MTSSNSTERTRYPRDRTKRGGRGKGTRNLKPWERDAIDEKHEEGLTLDKIGELLGRDPRTVKKYLKDTEEYAKTLLTAEAPRASKKWGRAIDVAAEKGDHRPAKELLEAVKVVEPPKTKDGPSQQLIVVGEGFKNLTGATPIIEGTPPPSLPGEVEEE